MFCRFSSIQIEWTRKIDYDEGSASNAGFPDMPERFIDNRDFGNIGKGLLEIRFNAEDTAKIMGNNWLRFIDENFGAV